MVSSILLERIGKVKRKKMRSRKPVFRKAPNRLGAIESTCLIL